MLFARASLVSIRCLLILREFSFATFWVCLFVCLFVGLSRPLELDRDATGSILFSFEPS